MLFSDACECLTALRHYSPLVNGAQDPLPSGVAELTLVASASTGRTAPGTRPSPQRTHLLSLRCAERLLQGCCKAAASLLQGCCFKERKVSWLSGSCNAALHMYMQCQHQWQFKGAALTLQPPPTPPPPVTRGSCSPFPTACCSSAR